MYIMTLIKSEIYNRNLSENIQYWEIKQDTSK